MLYLTYLCYLKTTGITITKLKEHGNRLNPDIPTEPTDKPTNNSSPKSVNVASADAPQGIDSTTLKSLSSVCVCTLLAKVYVSFFIIDQENPQKVNKAAEQTINHSSENRLETTEKHSNGDCM